MERRTFIGSVLGGISSLLLPWRDSEPEEIVWTKGEGTIMLDGPRSREYYWVTTYGYWEDPNCWSDRERGPGGYGVPGEGDDVFLFPRQDEHFNLDAVDKELRICRNMTIGGDGLITFDDNLSGN